MASSSKSEMRKEQILRAAEKIFARKGFHDATISDVSREAKVSDATIYEYFSSKEELLFSIPGKTTRKQLEEIEAILEFLPRNVDKIRCIIKRYFWFYDSHPDHAAVTMLILKQNRKFLEMPAYQDVQEMSRLILRVIEEGIAKGEFRKDLDPYLVRASILGTIEHLVIRKILLGKPERLIDLSEPLADLLIQGMIPRDGEKVYHIRLALGSDEHGAEKPAPRKTPAKSDRSNR
jgi:TetR/AcrR family fatty acid metabolism transcriptional regulator